MCMCMYEYVGVNMCVCVCGGMCERVRMRVWGYVCCVRMRVWGYVNMCKFMQNIKYLN